MTVSTSRPGKLDLSVYEGDVLARHMTVTADTDPFDFTGYTAAAQVRKYVGGDVELELEVTLGTGTIDLRAEPTDMAALSGAYIWDLELTPSGGDVFTLVAGKFIVGADVTR